VDTDNAEISFVASTEQVTYHHRATEEKKNETALTNIMTSLEDHASGTEDNVIGNDDLDSPPTSLADSTVGNEDHELENEDNASENEDNASENEDNVSENGDYASENGEYAFENEDYASENEDCAPENLAFLGLPRHPITPGLASGGSLNVNSLRAYDPTVDREVLSCPISGSFPTTLPVMDWSRKIRAGTYVAFAFDTKVIANRYPSGSEIHDAITNFPRKVYMGLVSNSYHMEIEGDLVNQIVIHLTSRKVPLPCSPMEYWMPLHPVTSESHDYEPLRTEPLLPFTDCKQWTVCTFKLIVETMHESPLSFALEDDEFARFEEVVVHDQRVLGKNGSAEVTETIRDFMVLENLSVEAWTDIRLANVELDPQEFIEAIRELEKYVSHQI
jgi:hypothetical protein